MESINMLSDLTKRIDEENGICSYSDISNNKDFVINEVDKAGIMPILREEIRYLLGVLFRADHYYKLVTIETMYWDLAKYYPMYISSIYFNNLGGYRNLPVFLKAAIDRLGIEEYKDVPLEYIERIIKREFKTTGGTYDDGHPLCELADRRRKYEYDRHNYHYEGPLNPSDVDDKFIWSEHRTYDDENAYLRQFGYPYSVLWASRYAGDGLGFDILSYDPFTRREKLIEVKARKENHFDLTDNEVAVMKEASMYNADYYVYGYLVNEETIDLTVFKYDPKEDELIDVHTGDHYTLSKRASKVDRNGDLVYCHDIIPKEKNKEKTLTN